MRTDKLIRKNFRAATACGTLLFVLTATAAPPRYASEVMADKPFGYWRFNDVVGVKALDSSGHGNTGVYSGGVIRGQHGLPPGVPGDKAVIFDGKTGRVVVPNSATLNPSVITMEAKIRWSGRNDFQQRILEKPFFIDAGQEQAQYGLSILPNAKVRVELRTGAPGPDPICGANMVCAESKSVVSVGVETHIAATYDGKEVRIYLNGALNTITKAVATGPIEPVLPSPNNSNDALGLGNQSVRNRPFRGLIDEIALYDHVLSAKRILVHYRSQFGR